MFGFRYLKVPPTTYVMQFRDGKVVRRGTGTSFWYFAPSSTIVLVPVGSRDVPFAFAETTADFQSVTVQGSLAFRVKDPEKLAALLDHSVNRAGAYVAEDPAKLPPRVAHAAQTATRAEIQVRALRACLVEADVIAATVRASLAASPTMQALGIEVIAFSILSVKPNPDTSRALEAEARERLLREADDAIYSRRNNAVEQERKIKENELATEVAVQTKKREIEQTKLDANIALEERRKDLVALESENVRTTADATAYASDAQLKPLKALDPKALQVLASGHADPRMLIAMAFQEIAGNATKVGNLNISPDLLETLLKPTNGHARD